LRKKGGVSSSGPGSVVLVLESGRVCVTNGCVRVIQKGDVAALENSVFASEIATLCIYKEREDMFA